MISAAQCGDAFSPVNPACDRQRATSVPDDIHAFQCREQGCRNASTVLCCERRVPACVPCGIVKEVHETGKIHGATGIVGSNADSACRNDGFITDLGDTSQINLAACLSFNLQTVVMCKAEVHIGHIAQVQNTARSTRAKCRC